MSGKPYAEVIGDPIAHSKSPLIHGFWLEKSEIRGDYKAAHVPSSGLEDYFAIRRADPLWRGCNVTVPHKEAVVSYLDRLTPLAREVGAVNTITREGGALVGDNTDVLGILDALPPELFDTPPRRACLIGSGGAALGALSAFRRMPLEQVDVNVRNPAKGEALLARLGEGPPARGAVAGIGDAPTLAAADLIVNASVLGMVGKDPMPPAVLEQLRDAKAQAVVFDMVYHPLETALLKTASDRGLRTVDGLQMLVGQAAAAFSKFFGAPAPREHDAELRRLLTS